jgi:hypothetical protein
MKLITGKTTTHLNYARSEARLHKFKKLAGSVGLEVKSFRALQDAVAYLGYNNPGFDIFLRAQGSDYLGPDQVSALYPSIYRNGPTNAVLPQATLDARVQVLRAKEDALVTAVKADGGLKGRTSLLQHEESRWALLQHYRCCATPLVDLTRNTRVAASFVVGPRGGPAGDKDAYIYVVGLPYQTGNITHSFNDNLRILNLRNVLGHLALRPHEQEGYLAGSLYTWDKAHWSHNIAVRLLGKLRIPLSAMADAAAFWGAYDPIPDGILLPKNDRMRKWLEDKGLQPDSV